MENLATVPLEAASLFEFCRSRQDAGAPVPFQTRVLVRGVVARAFLGHKYVPRIVLRADQRGLRFVECQCLTDEVLLRAREGDQVTIHGYYLGMEDSLTVVLTLCELADGAGAAKTAPHPLEENHTDALHCYLCGKNRSEVHLLIPVLQGAICDQCAIHRMGKGRTASLPAAS